MRYCGVDGLLRWLNREIGTGIRTVFRQQRR